MIATLTKGLSRGGLIAALAVGTLALSTPQAGAVSASVRANCTGDYLSYCSQHPVGSKGVRRCMRANGHRLSKRCVRALVSSGEVSKRETSRRSARR